MSYAVTMQEASRTANPPTTTATVLEFVCLFTHDLKRKQKRWQDGRLKYHTYNRRIIVHDDRGHFIGDAHWLGDDHLLLDGEELELERGAAIVQVAECVGSREQDLTEVVDKRARDVEKRRKETAAKKPPAGVACATPSTAGTIPATAVVRTAPYQSAAQRPHKPLHSLIASPGPLGRAAIPTRSPYEAKRVDSGGGDSGGRPMAKRRRLSNSPPSKSGYASSLFGTKLTLSGGQPSTPLPRMVPLADKTNVQYELRSSGYWADEHRRPDSSVEVVEHVTPHGGLKEKDTRGENNTSKRLRDNRHDDTRRTEEDQQALRRRQEPQQTVPSQSRQDDSDVIMLDDEPEASTMARERRHPLGPDRGGEKTSAQREKRSAEANAQADVEILQVSHTKLPARIEEDRHVANPRQKRPIAKQKAPSLDDRDKDTDGAAAGGQRSEVPTRLDEGKRTTNSRQERPTAKRKVPPHEEHDEDADSTPTSAQTNPDPAPAKSSRATISRVPNQKRSPKHSRNATRDETTTQTAEVAGARHPVPRHAAVLRPEEPRTELRIRSRRKRGLMMMQQKTLDSSTETSASSGQADRRETSKGLASNEGRTSHVSEDPDPAQTAPCQSATGIETRHETRDGRRVEDVDVQHSEEDKQPEIRQRSRRERSSNRTTSGNDVEAQIGSCSDSEDMPPAPRKSTRGRKSKDDDSPRKPARGKTGKDEDSAATGPRITKMARKSVKCKEVFGFLPPGNTSLIPSAIVAATNSMRLAMQTAAPEAVMEQSANGNVPAAATEQTRSTDEESVRVPVVDNAEGRHRETAAAPKISNPATRGKKAARKEDAAGETPQPVVLVEASVTISKVAPVAAPGSKAVLPGFSKVNGGAWSKHAEDLLAMRRPVEKASRR